MFFWSISVFSQEKTKVIVLENKSLDSIIPVIETRYHIKFSYLNALLNNKTASITIHPETKLENILQDIEKQTFLNIEITGNDYVTISDYTSKDNITICGYIFDEELKPLKNISVFLKATRTNIYTDENGYFQNQEVPYRSVILISAPGYRQRVFNSSSFLAKACKNIYLSHSLEVLDEVVVQEYLTKGITQNKRIINIDLKDIEILPGLTEPDILQSVQLSPGVNSPYETASGIYVRGSAPHQNLILWNGIKTYHQGHLFGMLSAFNPNAVKEVDFIKSGVSAKYGDRIAGIIDIKTENEVAENFNGGVGFNMIHADAVIHAPIIKDKLSVQISGRRSYTDLWKTFTYQQLSDRVFQNTKIAETTELSDAKNDFFYTDYNTNIIGQLSIKDKIEINSIYSKNDLDFRRSDSLTSYNDLLTTENEGYNIKWDHLRNEKLSIETSGYYTKYLLNYQFITRQSDDITEIENKKNSIKDFGAALAINYKLSDYSNLSGGYQFSNNTIKYAFITTTPDYELILDQDDRFLNTHAAYSEYTYEIPKNFYISTGLRFNLYAALKKTYFEPRIFVRKNITNHWSVNLSGEYRSQAVNQIRESVISELSLENQVWTLADKTKFPIITSRQFTAGSSFKKHKWYFDIDGYYKQIDDITTLTAGFINPVDNTYHTGKSTVLGIDLFLKKRFNNYRTWISYSYINTNNQFEAINNNNSFPGNWNIEHTIKWTHFYKINDFQCSLGWIWHTGKAYTNISGIDDSGDIVILQYGEINNNNLPVYHRMDFSALYDFKLKFSDRIKYRIGLSILNLYNKKNLLNKEFRTTTSLDNRFINSDIYALGITPNISFRILW